jgi:two-component system phosphate regulon response regulator PhoB
MTQRILICEDEADLQQLLGRAFVKEGWTAVPAYDGRDALDQLATNSFDGVILDLNLPLVPGLEICRRIRRDPSLSALPVIFLSARAEEIDRVVGFEVGADDYVTKPFSVRELILRVNSVLRRARPGATPEATLDRIAFGLLSVEPAGHRVWVGGDEVELTPIEYRLLTAFLDRRGRALRREDLLARAWGSEWQITPRTVDTHVKRLRAKLGPAGGYLETLRGVGYRWAAAPG